MLNYLTSNDLLETAHHLKMLNKAIKAAQEAVKKRNAVKKVESFPVEWQAVYNRKLDKLELRGGNGLTLSAATSDEGFEKLLKCINFLICEISL